MNLVHSIIPVILPLIYIWNLTTSRQLHYHHPCINHKHLLPILWPWPFTLVPPTDYSLQSSQSSLSLSCSEPSNGFQKTQVLASSPAHHPPAPSHGSFLLCLECACHALLSESERGVIQGELALPLPSCRFLSKCISSENSSLITLSFFTLLCSYS